MDANRAPTFNVSLEAELPARATKQSLGARTNRCASQFVGWASRIETNRIGSIGTAAVRYGARGRFVAHRPRSADSSVPNRCASQARQRPTEDNFFTLNGSQFKAC